MCGCATKIEEMMGVGSYDEELVETICDESNDGKEEEDICIYFSIPAIARRIVCASGGSISVEH